MAKKNSQATSETFEKIAKEFLHLETLETRNSDSLDFKEQSVWGIKSALEAAYEAGKKEMKEKALKAYTADGNPAVWREKIEKL